MKPGHAAATVWMVNLFSKLITLIVALTQFLSEIYGISFASVSITILIGKNRIHFFLPSSSAATSAKNDGFIADKKPYPMTLYDWKKIAIELRQELRELES
jgi:hypothetical protein